MSRDIAMARARILRDAMLRHGVPEVSIELQPGRPSSRDVWTACRPVGATSHHIASHPTVKNPTPGLKLVKEGRPGLDGPLANGAGGVDLVYRILTLGLANHPGVGGPLVLSGPMGSYRIPENIGRPYLWGTEYEGGYDNATWDKVYTNRRTGKKMSFREFMGRCNAGLVEGIWLINQMGRKPSRSMDLSSYHIEHKTWAPRRKVDRLGYTTATGRKEVQKYDGVPKLPLVDLSNMKLAARGKIKKSLPGVHRVQAALNARYKTGLKVDGKWGSATTKAYKKHQKALGSAPRYCDGIPGAKDLEALGKNRFRVIA